MELPSHCGLLGQPVAFRVAGQPVCAVTQLFAAALVTVPPGVWAGWQVRAAEAQVDITDEKLTLRCPAGRDLLKALAWRSFNAAASSWDADAEGALCLRLAKSSTCLASWPYVFRSVAVRPATPSGVGTLESAWGEDCGEFEARADALLDQRRMEMQAFRVTFIASVREQMGSGQRLLPGQITLCFPGEGAQCLPFLHATRHLPAVAKLLRAIHLEVGIDLAAAAADERADKSCARRPLLSLSACLAAGLAGIEARRAQRGLTGVQAVAACVGCGAGEYASAVFAGVLRLQDVLKLVRAHAAAVEDADAAEDDLLLYEPDESEEVADGAPVRPREALAVRAQLAAETAVATALDGMSLRNPRIAAICGTTGMAYATAAAVREALPRAACAGPPSSLHWRQLILAVGQQGYGQLVDALADASKISVVIDSPDTV